MTTRRLLVLMRAHDGLQQAVQRPLPVPWDRRNDHGLRRRNETHVLREDEQHNKQHVH